MEDFKKGNRVSWTCKVRAGGKFECSGVIVKIVKTTFGGARGKHKKGAKILIDADCQYPFLGRYHTTVALDKLKSVSRPVVSRW